MSALDRKTSELRILVEDIVHKIRVLNAQALDCAVADLSMQELLLVEYLGDSGQRMMRELAEHLQLAVNSITGTVDKLERKLLVERQRSDEDRRVVHVALTKAGKAVYAANLTEKLAFLRRMLAALTEDEQEIFMVLFRKIARAGQKLAKSNET